MIGGMARTRRSVALAAALAGAVLVPHVADASAVRTQATTTPLWLTVLDAYRTASGLPAVTEDPTNRAGLEAHARYLSITGSLSHGESVGHPLYSPEGNAAGAASVVGGWMGRTATDREHVEGWLRAPFHAVHLLEPRLRTAEFASANDLPGAVLTSAGVMDVIRGLTPAVLWDRPILFPADGSTVPLTRFESEHPNPYTACPGHRAPSGLPVLVMFPTAPGNVSATVTDESGAVLPSCTVDARYTNPVADDQRLGRFLLDQKNAAFVMPRDVFVPGRRYTVTFTSTSAGTATTTFTVAEEGSALPGPSPTPLVIVPKKAVRTTTTTMLRPTTTLPPIRSRSLPVRVSTTKRTTRKR